MDKESLKLKTSLRFWYQYQPSKENFNESLTPLATFNTVEQFWALPSKLEDNSYLYLFQSDIKPVWEDPKNVNGGSFILRFDKSKSDRIWEDVVLGFVSLSLGDNQEINGVRLKIRKDQQIIEVWVRDATNQQNIEKATQWILAATKLNRDTALELILFQVQ